MYATVKVRIQVKPNNYQKVFSKTQDVQTVRSNPK